MLALTAYGPQRKDPTCWRAGSKEPGGMPGVARRADWPIASAANTERRQATGCLLVGRRPRAETERIAPWKSALPQVSYRTALVIEVRCCSNWCYAVGLGLMITVPELAADALGSFLASD